MREPQSWSHLAVSSLLHDYLPPLQKWRYRMFSYIKPFRACLFRRKNFDFSGKSVYCKLKEQNLCSSKSHYKSWKLRKIRGNVEELKNISAVAAGRNTSSMRKKKSFQKSLLSVGQYELRQHAKRVHLSVCLLDTHTNSHTSPNNELHVNPGSFCLAPPASTALLSSLQGLVQNYKVLPGKNNHFPTHTHTSSLSVLPPLFS